MATPHQRRTISSVNYQILSGIINTEDKNLCNEELQGGFLMRSRRKYGRKYFNFTHKIQL